jgi:hypothetical protein
MEQQLGITTMIYVQILSFTSMDDGYSTLEAILPLQEKYINQ